MAICLALGAPLGEGVQAPAAGSADKYAGHAKGDRQNSIRFRIEGKRVRFKTSGLLVACDDGVSVRRALPALQLRFIGHRNFEGDQYMLEPGGFQSFAEVNGRVRQNGTATGSIFYLEIPISGPDEPHEPDCSTLGRTRWTAKPK